MNKEQQEEITKCAADFAYFCEKYVKVEKYNPDGSEIVPFRLYGYQERLAKHIGDHRFTIFSKFRRGGFTTEMAAYGLWLCLFSLDQKVQYDCVTDRTAQDVGSLVKRMLMYLPDWMTGQVLKMTNDHQKSFPDTGGKMTFHAAAPSCGQMATLLIIDEASYVPQMDSYWKAVWPIVASGGKCVVMSTVNYDNDWFWATLQNSRYGLNKFSEFRSEWHECPVLVEEEQELRGNMGSSLWKCQMEQIPQEYNWGNPFLDDSFQKESQTLWRSITDDFVISKDCS